MPRMLASIISFALPRMLPVAIFLMNAGMSMCVGQARVHGASKQYKQRLASIFELWGANGGLMSAKFFSYSASVNFGARFLIIIFSVAHGPFSRVTATALTLSTNYMQHSNESKGKRPGLPHALRAVPLLGAKGSGEACSCPLRGPHF